MESIDSSVAWSALELTRGRYVHYLHRYGSNRDRLFSAADTAEALGLTRSGAALMAARLPESERGLYIVTQPDGYRVRCTLVSERGWCELILTSRGPLADAARGFLRTVWRDRLIDLGVG